MHHSFSFTFQQNQFKKMGINEFTIIQLIIKEKQEYKGIAVFSDISTKSIKELGINEFSSIKLNHQRKTRV